jgi:hypothetical protein
MGYQTIPVLELGEAKIGALPDGVLQVNESGLVRGG